MSELEDLLDPAPVGLAEFLETWEDCRMDPFVQVHTSGSTGTPKLVTLPHGNFRVFDAMQTLETNELAGCFNVMQALYVFPSFHIVGITYTIAAPC